MSTCQTEIDKFTDPTNMPINMNYCGEVMDLVTTPFVQE
jgi:carboxypeptidase D